MQKLALLSALNLEVIKIVDLLYKKPKYYIVLRIAVNFITIR